MKRRLISLMLSLACAVAPMSALANTTQEDAGAGLLQKIFGKLDDLSDNNLNLPYHDGTQLSDVREPLYLFENKGQVFGNDGASWANTNVYITLERNFSINGKSYNIEYGYKPLAMSEGDFNSDGRKNQLAVLVAAKTTDNRSLLLLCVTKADALTFAAPVVVLYEGSADFFDNIGEFVNCMEIVCADVNGDRYDEIVTATPTNLRGGSSVPYGFDRYGGSYLWKLKEDGRTALSWKEADGWESEPAFIQNSLQSSVGNSYLGAPGVTASMAAADIDGDGYDDLVTAISSAKVQYTPTYANSMYALYYIGGAPTVSEMIYEKRKNLSWNIQNALSDLSLSATSGEASGFDVTICDIDNSGTPTIFMSLKETVHAWAAYSGEKMYTPSYYVVAFDYNKSNQSFKTSTVHHGGIYHHGWVDSSPMSDSDYVYHAKKTDAAPIRIGVLKDDFGYAEQVKSEHADARIISSGTLIADQTYIPFVRCADGYTYSYFTRTDGLSYTGIQTNGEERITGFTDKQCVFFNNGINVYNIKTANISFNGTAYEDAAFVSAYTEDGFKTYYLSRLGNGYQTNAALFDQTSHESVTAMPDIDSDSVCLRYEKHGFFWADPVIVAALASPPYFNALPSDYYTNGATTYGRSIATSSGTAESFTISAGAYLSTEVKAGAGGADAVFEVESEALRSSFSEQENSLEISYTQSFSASGGADTIILATVGYDAYLYTAFYEGEDGTRTETPYVVYVPHKGSDSVKTASLSRADYNEFAKYAADALPDINSIFGHTAGKPETYPHSAPTGNNIQNGSVMIHKSVSGFPANNSAQTQSIEITKEKANTSSAGMSVSTKLGGGTEVSAENILKYAEIGTKITGGYVQEKEYERGKIETRAVGTTFEGTVCGQGDGFNTDGGTKKASFNWKLLHYIYDFNQENAVQRFPVITYITSDVTQPEGVIPSSVTVSPASAQISQVGPATDGYISRASFTVTAPGVSREAYTALEGAPFGMSLYTGGTNIGSSDPYPFDVLINGNVKPGSYDLQLNIGGVLSNTFTVTVTPYEAPTWIAADTAELDFGSVRYDKVGGTPAAASQTVTVSNIHTAALNGFSASLGEDSPFEITQSLSSSSLAAQGTSGDSATVRVAPKKGLEVGTHTDTLTLANSQTAAYVSLTYTVTEPTSPGSPRFSGNMYRLVNPVTIDLYSPEDDGGERITDYLYTIRDHEAYTTDDGQMIWKSSGKTVQSGYLFSLTVPDELTIGNQYTIGVKAVNKCGESEPVWYEFEVWHAENNPDPIRNIKAFPENGKITVTWDEPEYWGETELVPEIAFKTYQIFLKNGDSYLDIKNIDRSQEREYSYSNLTNGVEYEVLINSRTTNRFSDEISVKATPSAASAVSSRPRELKAELSYQQATLSWTEPGATGNTSITGYQVSSDGGTNWTNTGLEKSYTFTGLTANQTYDFAVRAINSAGAGDAAYTKQTIPNSLSKPELVHHFPDIINGLIPGYKQLELVWKPVAAGSGGDEISYEVRLDDGEWTAIEPYIFGDTLRWIFTGLENGQKYKVSVRACDSEGAGPAATTESRYPRETDPRPIINPIVMPRNGSMQFFGEKYDNRYSMQYSINGGSWTSFTSGDRTSRYTSYENGKEYTVAISASSSDSDNMPVRATQYFKCTPDANVPDEPSAPEIRGYVGADYARIEWTPAGDGGRPILYYDLTLDDEEPIRLPADQTAFVLDISSKNGCHARVAAVNEVGTSETNGIYLYLNTHLYGQSALTAPSNTLFQSEPYQLAYTYYGWNEETEERGPVISDISNDADWSIISSEPKITWDKENRRIIADHLPDGTYQVTVLAKVGDNTYELPVTVKAGDFAAILSAEQTTDGILARLYLPQSQKATLAVAVYQADSRLSGVSLTDITSASLTDGAITSPVKGQGTNAKIMLLESMKTLRPLCGSRLIPIQ